MTGLIARAMEKSAGSGSMRKLQAYAYFLLAIVAVLASLPAISKEASGLDYDLYRLSTDAEMKVDNDTMEVVLSASHQQSKASQSSERVNEDMAWAMSMIKPVKAIEVETTSYQTYPVYKNGKITSWRTTQNIKLTTKAFDKLSELVGHLQEKLNVTSMQFSVSKARLAELENELTIAALQRFSEKAAIIQQAMGAKSYRVVETDINVSNGGFRPRPLMKMQALSLAHDERTAPQVEGGESSLRVAISGRIQLRK